MTSPLSLLFSADGTSPAAPPPPDPPPAGAPNNPTNNTLATTSASALAQTWTDASSDETGFTARIATNSGMTTNLQTDSTIAANATSKNWTGLTEGTEYWADVRADKTGSSSSSRTATDNAFTQLATPTNFQALLSGGVVTFSWTNASLNYTELQIQKDAADFDTPLAFGTTQYQRTEAQADGAVWRVYARASGIPDSDKSGTQTGPPWAE